MKKIGLLLIAAALIFGLSSCDTATDLTKEEALEVVEVLSSATTDSIYGQGFSRSGDEMAKALSASFTENQTAGGTAVFTFLTEQNSGAGDGLASGAVYFDVEFTDFVVTVIEDDGATTDYTLNGTMYMEYTIDLEIADDLSSMAYEFVYLLYTDSDDTLSIVGGTINTSLDLNIKDTLTMNIDGTAMTMSYTISGICNGYTFEDETGEFTYTY